MLSDMARVLGAARESRTEDHGSSLAGQREQIQRWAQVYRHEVVHVTEDASTSGALSPFKRDNLGPWLTDADMLAQWDVLVTAKVDRVSRSVVDFHDLLSFCRDQGKSYVSVGESFDLGTAMGRMVAQILAVFAEFERERISERARDGRKRTVAAGYWPGGWLPFGWRADDDGKGYLLVEDDTTALLAREMAARLVGGEPTTSIARWLNGLAVKTSHGNAWTTESVRKTLLGKYLPELLVDEEVAAKLAAMLAVPLRRPVSERYGDGYMLTRIVFCGVCEAPLYAAIKRERGYGYYQCRRSHVRARMDDLETAVEQSILDTAGEQELRRRVTVRGDDHSRQIVETEQQLATVLGIPEIDASPLEAKLAKLRETPHEPDRIEWVPVKVGNRERVTVRQYWLLLAGDTETNAFLREQCVRVTVSRDGVDVDTGLLGVRTEARTEAFTL
jgi:site-specific DNA recombinase